MVRNTITEKSLARLGFKKRILNAEENVTDMVLDLGTGFTLEWSTGTGLEIVRSGIAVHLTKVSTNDEVAKLMEVL